MTLTLDFGYNRGIPADAKAAWGARLIVNQDGMVDLVPDRLGFAEGSDPEAKERLSDYLNTEVGKTPFDNLRSSLQSGFISTRDDVEHVLFSDGKAKVVGSAQSSAGYFYIVAYLTPDTDVCVFCEMELTRDSDGVWVDDSERNVCPGSSDLTNENGAHVASGGGPLYQTATMHPGD